MKKLTSLCILLFFCKTALANEKLNFERHLSTPVVDYDTVEIITGSGRLKVVGGVGELLTVDVTVKSADYAQMAEFVDEFETKMLFYIKQHQGKLQVMAKARKSMYNTPNILLDVQIKLPSYMNLLIDDGYGVAVIENMNGQVDIDDESGSMRLKNISNNVIVKSASGPISISDIVGQVNIDDKKGDIELSRIKGDVMIKNRSGNIHSQTISGNLTLDDGTGDVVIDGLSGQLVLLDDRSGKLQVNGKSVANK